VKLAHVEILGFRSIGSRIGFTVGKPSILAGHNDAGKSATVDAVRFLLNGYTPIPEDATKTQVDGTWTPGSQIEVVGEFVASAEEQAAHGLMPRTEVRRVFEPQTGTMRYEIRAEVPVDERFRDLDSMKVDELKELLGAVGLPVTGAKPDLLTRAKTRAEESPTKWEWTTCPRQVVDMLPAVQYFDATASSGAEQAVREALDGFYKGLVAADKYSGELKAIERQITDDLESESEQLRAHIDSRLADGSTTHIAPQFSFRQTPLAVTLTRQGADGRRTPMSHGGAGSERRVALAVWEYNTRFLEDGADTVVVYDEPDTHLDYLRQRDLMRIVREQASLPNVSMVIATHSMNLIDGVDIRDVVHVRATDGITEYERLEGDADLHLGAIAASVGLRNTVLLHERLFVGVEGDTERAALPALYLSWRKRHLESAGIAIWNCGNNEGALAFAQFLNLHGRNVAFLVDSDSRENSKNFTPHALTKFGLDAEKHAIYIGAPNEFEDTFPDEVWAACASEKWPRMDARPWHASDFSALRSPPARKFSDGVVKMFHEHFEGAPVKKAQLAVELAHFMAEKSIPLPESIRLAFEELEKRAGE